MKFVFNQEKNDRSRRMLMMQPTVAEAKAALEKDDTDAYAWYVYGKALALEKKYDEAIEAHSQASPLTRSTPPTTLAAAGNTAPPAAFGARWRTTPWPSNWTPPTGSTGTTGPPP